jgi:hypothetical protein
MSPNLSVTLTCHGTWVNWIVISPDLLLATTSAGLRTERQCQISAFASK